MKENYIISEKTNFLEQKAEMLIINELSTEIILDNTNIKRIIENSCLFYGCNYAGRKTGAKNLIHENYKLPIILKECGLLVIFPLNSLRSNNNIWVNYNNIKNYYKISKSKVLVEFIDNSRHTFHVSYYIFHNQIMKSSRLIVMYNCRNNK